VDKKEALSLAMNLGWTMLFSLLLPLLAGIWLDKKLNTAPLFILIGAGLGILAATVGVARMAMRTFRSVDGDDAAHEEESNGEEEPD
jgi:F0F1-type ATP synthase assembly protein I